MRVGRVAFFVLGPITVGALGAGEGEGVEMRAAGAIVKLRLSLGLKEEGRYWMRVLLLLIERPGFL